MTRYEINIAKAYTLSDWRGLPAHRHFAKVTLDDTLSEHDALAEIARLREIYPWPTYHLTLAHKRVVTESATLASTAPTDFLESHQWAYPSIHPESGGEG